MTATMTDDTALTGRGQRTIRAPRGAQLSCKGWQQEAALRMLMNNLDPDVAERPDELVVYGGTGRAARSWEAFDAIVASLRALENDETLLVQSPGQRIISLFCRNVSKVVERARNRILVSYSALDCKAALIQNARFCVVATMMSENSEVVERLGRSSLIG